MKIAKILSIAITCIISGLIGMVTTAGAQTYFSDNFDNPAESENKWVDLYGTWEFNDGEYHQLLNAVNCMSVVSDDYWDDSWNDYTFELKANRIGGAEGFLIMFRCMGQMQPRDMAVRVHPPRMADDPISLQYWWNLGGWANTRSCVERWINGGVSEHGNTADTITTGDWYNIKIVSSPTNYILYLNDEAVATVDDNTEDGHGRIGLAVWSTTARFDDVIVYGPDGPGGEAVEPVEKLTTTWAYVKSN